MTRINVVPVEWLTDKHLFAEWRELPRIFSQRRQVSDEERVPSYRLGRGHVLFFYVRPGFLAHRHQQLTAECLRRGIQLSKTEPDPSWPAPIPDWTPSPEDLKTNLTRLQERLREQLPRHRFWKKLVSASHYDRSLP